MPSADCILLYALHTAAQPSAVDPQLNSLLKVKAAIDTTGVLEEWSSATGAAGGYCSWRGVECIGKTYVTGINIWSGPGIQGLQGTLPPAAALSGLPNMTVLNIGEQPGIKGTLPADWSRMTQLEDVRLTKNSLTGSIPASWGGMTKLRILNLTTNGIFGKIPDSFRGLTSLQLLILNENGLTGVNACNDGVSFTASMHSVCITFIGLHHQKEHSLHAPHLRMCSITACYGRRSTMAPPAARSQLLVVVLVPSLLQTALTSHSALIT
jgi:hypothetical protein